MKKLSLDSLYLYPILFPASVVLTLAGANLTNLTFREITLSTLMLCAVVGVFFGILYRVQRDGHRASFLVFLGALWMAYFGVVVSLIQSSTGIHMDITKKIVVLAIWSITFAFIGSPWLWRHVKKPSTITSFLNLLLAIIIVYLFARISVYQSGNVNLDQYRNTFPVINNLKTTPQKPDIYYIIVDGYGQADTLEDLYKWDNSDFIDYLKQTGFYIADESQSNYVQTGLSLSSSLNFDYLPSFPDNSRDGRPLINFIQQNRLQKTLKQLGYTTYTFQTPYEPSNITNSEHFYREWNLAHTDVLVSLLMMNSIFSIGIDLDWIKLPITYYGDQQNLVLDNLDEIERIAGLPGQKYVFLHLVIPHEPFIFNKDGPITPDAVYALSGVNEFQNTTTQHILGYIAQATYLNQALKNSLDIVLQRSITPPIIILQGDHGPGIDFNQTVRDTCLRERFGILNAYLMPGIDPAHLYPSISPVNTFRLILNIYFGASLELLPDLHYYSSINQPYSFIAIGEEMNNPCNFP